MTGRILLPIDGSDAAEAILPQLRRLLTREEAEVIVFRADDFVPSFGIDYAAAGLTVQDAAQKYVDAVVIRLRESGVRANGYVLPGPAASTILHAAEDLRVTMIAMSSHGRTGLARWVLGSVTEKVMRAAHVPMLLMRSFQPADREWRRSAPDEHPFRHILVPVDDTEHSLRVIPHAAELARHFRSDVAVLHVAAGRTTIDSLDRAAARLSEAKKAFEREGVSVVPILRRGETGAEDDPATGILNYCIDKPVDLIAMTTHGRSGVPRWAFGSVTEKVLRASAVPMLVVREHPPAGAA